MIANPRLVKTKDSARTLEQTALRAIAVERDMKEKTALSVSVHTLEPSVMFDNQSIATENLVPNSQDVKQV